MPHKDPFTEVGQLKGQQLLVKNSIYQHVAEWYQDPSRIETDRQTKMLIPYNEVVNLSVIINRHRLIEEFRWMDEQKADD